MGRALVWLAITSLWRIAGRPSVLSESSCPGYGSLRIKRGGRRRRSRREGGELITGSELALAAHRRQTDPQESCSLSADQHRTLAPGLPPVEVDLLGPQEAPDILVADRLVILGRGAAARTRAIIETRQPLFGEADAPMAHRTSPRASATSPPVQRA